MSNKEFLDEFLGFSIPEGVQSKIDVFHNGNIQDFEMDVARIEQNNEPTLLTSIGDMTDQRKLAERVRQSQKMEAIGQLAGGVAHDFNNILTVVKGYLIFSQDELPSDHPVQEYLYQIKKAADRAAEIVRQILTFSHNRDTECEAVKLESLVQDSLSFLRAFIPARIEIESNLKPGLPAVFADPTQIHQILMNLAVNASHAIKENPGQIEIVLTDVSLESDQANVSLGLSAGRYLRLSVTDTGCGMDRATRERIFEPFYTTKPQGEGTGLGLSIVHGIMKSHNGAVTVYSEEGQGTTFNLYFPALEDKLLSKTTEKIKAKVAGSGHILYVDDEPQLVFLAERMLRRAGYEVSGFKDPDEALDAFRSEPDKFDIVVSDLSMPKMDGSQLIRQMLDVRPNIPVVMATGYVRPQDLKAAEELGVKEIFLKPNSMENLAEMLQQLMSKFVRAQ